MLIYPVSDGILSYFIELAGTVYGINITSIDSVLPWPGTGMVTAFSSPARCLADAASIHTKLFSNKRVKVGAFIENAWVF